MDLPKRKPQRLKSFDYAAEKYYFVTMCTMDKQNLFGNLINQNDTVKMVYTFMGEIALKHLKEIENHFDEIKIDKYVIMPNHIHIIIVIGCNGNSERSRPFPTLSTVIGLYKSGVSREVGCKIWQKSFHDHIIRNKNDYLKIREYIEKNPLKWDLDCYCN
ncbi:MAG: transposase [Ruminococcus sp.]